MISLFKISLLFILTVLVQNADGNQRIVYVSEVISDDNFTASDEEDKIIHNICCVYGNCSYNSLDNALANLTSNVVINITTDVTLSSLVKVSDIENVSIIGHNNPTVHCKIFGGIHLNFCNNCIIQGITWDGCGIENGEPGLMLANSSNITINNCCFQHLKSQAVLLSEVSRDVNIDHCNFVHNNHYRGHGAAIHYSSSNVTNCRQFSVFTISDCNFTYNYAKSLVYIENTISKHNVNINFRSTKFCHNQGVSVYAENQNIYLNGKNLFQNNTAKIGAGIYISDHSTVIFDENSYATFTENFGSDGGTVFLNNHSNVIFNKNSITTFSDNKATEGGAIYSGFSSNITFKSTCKVTFNHNSAECGGAIWSHDYSYISFEEKSSPVFSNNSAEDGGAIYSDSYISFEGNSSPVFSNNSAEDGGAIYSDSYILFEGNSSPVFSNNIADRDGGAIASTSFILFEGNSSTVFSNNIADWHGGAIYSDGYIFFEGNSSTVFSNNSADRDGGAIASTSFILYEGNSSTVFSNNIADWNGGAIYSNSYILFEGNSSTVFSNNIAGGYGGAITFNSYILFKGNTLPVFSDNTAHYGGAISSLSASKISFKGFSAVVFRNNTAEDGGAIYSHDNSYILFKGNTSPMFSDNTADRYGGAISSQLISKISFEGFSAVVFRNNIAKDGGAIYSHDNSYILFKGNTSPVFSDNTADRYGGAITSLSASKISFEGFSAVVFRNNIAEYGGAVLATDHSDIIFSDNSTVTFTNNKPTFVAPVYSNVTSKIIVIGNSTVIFDDLSAKWCNNTCLPYTGQDDVVTINSNGIVWCSDQKSFICQSKKCHCNKLEDLLVGLKSVNIKGTVTLSTVVKLENLNNISIIGYNNTIVICVNGGGLYLASCSNLIIEGITWIGCGNDIFETVIGLEFSNVTIQKCTFHYSFGKAISLYGTRSNNVSINYCNFVNNNRYKEHGAAIHCNMGAYDYEVNINISNCNFNYNGDAMSIIYFDNEYSVKHNIYLSTSSFHNNLGVPVYVSKSCTLHVSGEVLFENNVAENGTGIYISDHSTVIFDESSNGKFINNSVDHNGATIFLIHHSNVIFEKNL